MNDSVTTSDLARWLEPAGIELSHERLRELASVVAELGVSLPGRELDAVRAAHGRLADRTRGWAAGLLGQNAPTVNPDDATELLERLLAAAVINHLDDSHCGISCALAVESAQFLGLSPRIGDLPARATEALAAAGRSVRQRSRIERVAGHAKSLRSLADALDNALDAMAERQDALDEEVEMLWWAVRATADGTALSELEPAVRAVIAARDLAARTKALPGPPSARFLLARVLGDSAGVEITLADLTGAASVHLRPQEVPSHQLLALRSAAAEQARQGADNDDKTWRTVVKRTLALDLSTSTTVAAGAQQVYRELLLERLLMAEE